MKFSLLNILILLIPGIAVPADALHQSEDDPAEVIWMIDGERSQNLPEEELRSLTPSQIDAYKDKALVVLKNHFSREGYFNVRIDSLELPETTNPDEAVLHVSLGDRYRVGSVSKEIIRYDDPPDPPDDFPIEGDLWDNDLIEDYIGQIITFYEDEGYPLAQVSIGQFEPDPETRSVDLKLEIIPGERTYAGGLSFDGLERLSSDWLQRVTGVSDSTLITPQMMETTRRKLEQIEMFEFVSEPQIQVRDGNSHLHFDVEELPATSFDILLGYMPDRGGPGSQGNTIVGQAELEVRNIFTQGSTMRMAFERMEPLVTRLDLGYRQEWVMSTPFSAGGSFDFLQQDTTYQVRNLSLEGGYRLSSTTSIATSFRRQNTSANVNPDLPIRALDGSSTFAGAGIRYSNTDDRYSPTSGVEFRIHAETGWRQITDPRADQFTLDENQRRQRVELYLQPYFSPLPRHIWTFRLNGYYLEGSDFTESDMERFGGARSLRGYREDQFLGSRIAWADTEYRYLLAPRSYAFAFGALGTYERAPYITEEQFEQTDGADAQLLYSWGLGFSYDTPVGFVSFTYAISRDSSPADGLVHFGMRSRF